MLPVDEFLVLDRNAVEWGVPVPALMENAGMAVADVVRDLQESGTNVLILCGPGNNGGDGLVAARHLENDFKVAVSFLDEGGGSRNAVCRQNLERVRHLLVDWDASLLEDGGLVVDALLGTGLRGELRQPYLGAVEVLNDFKGPVVSVDVPSGWGTRHAVRPDLTVTFHDVKEGMDENDCGSMVIVDIGIPPEAQNQTGPGEYLLYPSSAHDSHKGQNGRLLIVGGGPYTGAPSLAGMGACGIGVDLLHIATPESSFQSVASHSPLFIVHCLEGSRLGNPHVNDILSWMDQADCLLMGPGLGMGPETLQAVVRLMQECKLPLVVDADALHAIGPGHRLSLDRPMVLTPHGREFERLSGTSLPKDMHDRAEAVRQQASEFGCTILLKGETDIISDGQRIKFNTTGNSAMTSGGTGDVLAGVVAGLLSKGMTPFNAARLGAHLNGAAGDLSFRLKSYGMTALDLCQQVPYALKEGLGRALR